MDVGHWLPQWKSAVHKLLKEIFVSIIGEGFSLSYQLNFPLRDPGNGFASMKLANHTNSVSSDKAVVNLYPRLRVQEMCQLPPNLWAAIVGAMHNTSYVTCMQVSIKQEFERHLGTHPNWIRVPPALFHPRVPLFVGGEVVNFSSNDDSSSNNSNIVVNSDGKKYHWFEHPTLPRRKVDNRGSVQIGTQLYWNGNLEADWETSQTVAAFEQQIVRIIQLCFRHHSGKCLAAQNLCKLVIEQADKLNESEPRPIVFKLTNLPTSTISTSSTGYSDQECNVRQWMWKYAHTNTSASPTTLRPKSSHVCTLKLTFGEALEAQASGVAEAALCTVVTVIETLTPEEVMDIITLLSDITFNTQKRHTLTIVNDINCTNYGWMIAAVKVAYRIDAYENYLSGLMLRLGKSDSKTSDTSATSSSIGSVNFIKDLANIIGEYSLLSALPDNLLLSHETSTANTTATADTVSVLTVNEDDWNGKDDS